MKIWITRILRSKFMTWGHIQVIVGAIGTALAFVNPIAMPDLPVWAYTIAAMVAGVITYVLRFYTTQSLKDK